MIMVQCFVTDQYLARSSEASEISRRFLSKTADKIDIETQNVSQCIYPTDAHRLTYYVTLTVLTRSKLTLT